MLKSKNGFSCKLTIFGKYLLFVFVLKRCLLYYKHTLYIRQIMSIKKGKGEYIKYCPQILVTACSRSYQKSAIILYSIR